LKIIDDTGYLPNSPESSSSSEDDLHRIASSSAHYNIRFLDDLQELKQLSFSQEGKLAAFFVVWYTLRVELRISHG
jgi:hypothetical protein